MRNEGVEKVERYSSGGPGLGVIGLVLVVGTISYGIVVDDAGYAPWAFPLLGLVGVLLWAVMVRPAVCLRPDSVELRNITRNIRVPYARIRSVQVAQVTLVQTDDADYVCSGLGRSRRTQARDHRVDESSRRRHSLGYMIEEKLRRRAAQAQERGDEPGEVHEVWAWPEIVTAAVLAVVTVVLAVVG